MSNAAQTEPVGEPRQAQRGSVPSLDLRELWFAMLRWEWSSLVLVPSHAGSSAVWIAKALADVGASEPGRATKITPQGITLASTPELVEDLNALSTIRSMKTGSQRWRGGQTIIAIDPVVSNPAGIAAALAADAVLLCVELGKADIASARKTMEMIGRDRFIGCVIVK